MKLKDLKDVLTFRSFRPEPDDSSSPWGKRFVRENTLALNIGRRRVSWSRQTENSAGGDLRSSDTHRGSVAARRHDLVSRGAPSGRDVGPLRGSAHPPMLVI